MSGTDEPATALARDELGRWLPGGASPNPQGGAIPTYPRDWRELRDLAQQHAPEAIEKIVEIWRTSKSRKIQLAAINMLLDRAYGKPTETTAVLAEPSSTRYTGYELARRVAWLLLRPDERVGIPSPGPLVELLSEHSPVEVEPEALADSEPDREASQ